MDTGRIEELLEEIADYTGTLSRRDNSSLEEAIENLGVDLRDIKGQLDSIKSELSSINSELSSIESNTR
nr:MAG TPA: hypothetical protein [Caudoviricetes sp.]